MPSNKNENIIVTGSTGFIGSRLINTLFSKDRFNVTAVSRKCNSLSSKVKITQIQIKKIDSSTDWSKTLRGQDVVIHIAAVAHMSSSDDEVLAKYQSTNVEGTRNLALQAAKAGVKRFVLLSSIGVNGNISSMPFCLTDDVNPQEPYAKSKWHAEKALKDICSAMGMEFTILRPPMVYGPNAPGNFGRLTHWIKKGIPLPLGAVHNKRSLVALDNLVDLIIVCIDHPAAANQIFLAGDGQDLSTTDLLREVGEAMEKPARLIPVPSSILMAGAMMLGKKTMAQRLLGSLQVDISKTQELLDWQPPLTIKQGLKRCFKTRS